MIISSKKYACETCIKGHRSSSCRHTDRPLFEIKKKGRPVTQCEHCRELRKTKQVHVKCVCESKVSESTCQGSRSCFERAAFPNGLPKALEASVAFQTPAEHSSSDSDHGGVAHGHQCKMGDPCICVTPKTRNRKKTDSHDLPGPSGSPRGVPANFMSNAAIMKRIAELRPVLPRPALDMPPSGPVHVPSSGSIHAHPQRHHRSGHAPYELAYGMTHQHPLHHQSYMASHPNPTYSFNDQSYIEQKQMMGMNDESWNTNSGTIRFDNPPFPSLCGCGDDCNCPGCLHHNRAMGIPTSSAYASCTNPGTCGTCLDCTIMSLPDSALPVDDTALSIPSAQNELVADWLRQISPDASSFQQNLSLPTDDFQQWNQPPNMGQNPSTFMAPDFNYGTSNIPNLTPFPTNTQRGSFTPDARLGHRSRSSMSNIDPRLVPMSDDPQFLNLSDPSRSRSPSTSSQSSRQGSEGHGAAGGLPLNYASNGRQQGIYQGVRSSSQLHPLVTSGRGSTSPSNRSASSLPPFSS